MEEFWKTFWKKETASDGVGAENEASRKDSLPQLATVIRFEMQCIYHDYSLSNLTSCKYGDESMLMVEKMYNAHLILVGDAIYPGQTCGDLRNMATSEKRMAELIQEQKRGTYRENGQKITPF